MFKNVPLHSFTMDFCYINNCAFCDHSCKNPVVVIFVIYCHAISHNVKNILGTYNFDILVTLYNEVPYYLLTLVTIMN